MHLELLKHKKAMDQLNGNGKAQAIMSAINHGEEEVHLAIIADKELYTIACVNGWTALHAVAMRVRKGANWQLSECATASYFTERPVTGALSELKF